jgi:hypothetical protein
VQTWSSSKRITKRMAHITNIRFWVSTPRYSPLQRLVVVLKFSDVSVRSWMLTTFAKGPRLVSIKLKKYYDERFTVTGRDFSRNKIGPQHSEQPPKVSKRSMCVSASQLQVMGPDTYRQHDESMCDIYACRRRRNVTGPIALKSSVRVDEDILPGMLST